MKVPDRTKILLFFLGLISCMGIAHAQEFVPERYATLKTDRADGRYISTRGVVQYLMENKPPALAFREDFTLRQLDCWKEEVKARMERLMCHPDLRNLPVPKKIESRRRDGYRAEKWEAYPLPGCVITYFMLIPDKVSARNPAPAVLCIPGSGGSKESLAGEPDVADKFRQRAFPEKNAMALHYVKQGLIAVAVDNPCTGEASDLERYAPMSYDYENVSRFLLELGWSYLGYASYLDKYVLDWVKKQELVRKDRLIVSGFSLGTEPLMVLGVLDPSIYAFVYNDFLCRTRERALVMSVPDKKGYRSFPNSIRHLIPGFLCNFDFPDLVAALAPRPLICTEGGLDRDFALVSKAYEIAGKKSDFKFYHYPKFTDPSARSRISDLPVGLEPDTYFSMVNVEPGMHYFKEELVIPWIRKLLGL